MPLGMTSDQWISLLVTLTLVELMIAIGLGVSLADVLEAAKEWQLTLRAVVANYLLVPAATIALLLLYRADPQVAAGFLILAACPGARYRSAVRSHCQGERGDVGGPDGDPGVVVGDRCSNAAERLAATNVWRFTTAG